MQVILPGVRIKGPGRAAKVAEPIIGRSAIRGWIAPDVPIAFGVVATAAALQKPGVFIRGVVGHQVKDQLHAALMDFSQQAVKIRHAAKHGVDGAVIGHIVAEVMHGRRVNGRKPHHAHIEALQVIQAGGHASQVADAIAVTILKGARVNLVNNFSLPPGVCFTH